MHHIKSVKPNRAEVSSEVIYHIFVHIVKGLASETPKCDSLEYDMSEEEHSQSVFEFFDKALSKP